MTVRALSVACLLSLPLAAQAASLDSILACQSEVQRTTGRTVSEFDAIFQQRLLQTNVVRWPGILCEVRGTQVWSLTVDGQAEVVGGWPSPQAKATYDQLDAETAEAIRTLDTRKQLLAQRLREAEAQLKVPGADLTGVTGYVKDGIGQALGN